MLEPGYYEDGKFGVRIESLVLVKEAKLKHNFKDAGYLEFDVISLFPIQTKMIDKKLLTQDDVEWLNDFHKRCYDFIAPSLKQLGKTSALEWLTKATQPI